MVPVSSRVSRRAPARREEGGGGVTVDATEEPRPTTTLGDGGINGDAGVLTGIMTGTGARGGVGGAIVTVDRTEEPRPTITPATVASTVLPVSSPASRRAPANAGDSGRVLLPLILPRSLRLPSPSATVASTVLPASSPTEPQAPAHGGEGGRGLLPLILLKSQSLPSARRPWHQP